MFSGGTEVGQKGMIARFLTDSVGKREYTDPIKPCFMFPSLRVDWNTLEKSLSEKCIWIMFLM